MQRAAVRERPPGEGEIAVGLAVRDASTTIVGFCLAAARIPRPVPALSVDGRRLEPVGGTLSEDPPDVFNYSYYPATTSKDVAVVHAGRRLATLAFAELHPERCPLRASEGFRVVACGAVVVVEWSSPLRLRARAVELLDVDVWEGDGRARPLGFFFHGARDGRRGLVIRFGVRPPATGRVSLALRRVYVERGAGRIVEIALEPPVRGAFRLARAD